MLLFSIVRPILLSQLVLVLLLGMWLGGCAKPPVPREPAYKNDKTVLNPSDPPPPPETADEARLQFEDAERQLRGMLAKKGTETDVPPSAGHAQPQSRPPSADGLPMQDRCLVACKALASMQRSATQLCELTGQYDPRCENVQERVEAARELVYASCPSCVVAQP